MNNQYAAIILAAGSSTRMALEKPKQYQDLCGKCVLSYSLDTFIKSGLFAYIVVVIQSEHRAIFEASCQDYAKHIDLAFGSDTRQRSTFNGLEKLKSLSDKIDYVFIHDAARPLVSQDQIIDLKNALSNQNGAILACPVTDTIKQVNAEQIIEKTIDRGSLFAAQTPQAFPFAAIYEAHKNAATKNCFSFTDDSNIAEDFGLNVRIIASSQSNIKLTWAEDFKIAEILLKERIEREILS